MKRCFHWGPHGSFKHDRKYIQVMVINLWFVSKEPLKGTLIKLVEICSQQVFLFYSMFEIQTDHQTFVDFFVILMPNTVKKLKIEHCSTNSRLACSCMRAKKYPVTEIVPYIILHNYVLWSAHCRRFLCVWIDFLAIGRSYFVKFYFLFWKILITNSFFLATT